MDDVAKTKNDYAAVTKKDGGNLMTRDFTDDIYEKGFDERNFVPETSEMFCNLMVVVPTLKVEEFKATYHTFVEAYYATHDGAEEAKIPEIASHKYKAIKEHGGENWNALVKQVTGSDSAADWTENDEKNAIGILTSQEEKAFNKKKAARFPGALVPGSCFVMQGLDEKDKENTVCRLVAYKQQSDDIVKILRKAGYTARVFHYNQEKWNDEKKQRHILKEQLAQKTSKLHQTACECFQELFSALMHLKIIRVYIDGVLRFGIPPCFYVGLVIPRRGEERKILQTLSDHLADAEFKDMYGEKMDASEADDYWPFVNVALTSPNFLHVHSQ